MAENKTTFILHCDLIHTLEKLSDGDSGKLFKHILRYVNDKNPVAESVIIDLVFEPIKQTLKRELRKWESTCERNKINGSKGGRPKKPKKPTGLKNNPKNPGEPKKPDSDSDSDSDIIISEQIKNLNLWLTKHAYNVLKMQDQITDDQLTELKKKYTIEVIKDYLLRMHNWKELTKKNTSAYLTLLNWANKDEKKLQESRI